MAERIYLASPHMGGGEQAYLQEAFDTNWICLLYTSVSSLDGMESAKEAVKGLESAAGYIRREIAARVKMRRSPQFSFVADDSISESARIAKIIGDLHREEKGDSN